MVDSGPAVSTRRIVIVLGMHRSGTSAITRGLQALGVDLGDNLLPAVSGNNDKGFFEDIDVYSLNNEIIASIGQRWDSLSPVDDALLRGDAMLPFAMRARDILVQRLREGNCFGIKDPNLCRLLPFWQPVFEELGVETRYVLALRNPLSVAESLAKRDALRAGHSHYLWTVYMLSALQHTQRHKRVVIDFDALMTEPEVQMRRLAATLEISLGEGEESALAEFAGHFLEQRLRHFSCSDEDLAVDPRVPRLTLDLYRALAGMADDTSPNARLPERRREEFAQRLADLSPALQCITDTEKALRSEQMQLAGRRSVAAQETEFTVYFASEGQGFVEARTAKVAVAIGGGRQRLRLGIPEGNRRLRVDPAGHGCIARFWNIRILDDQGAMLHEAALDAGFVRDAANIVMRETSVAGAPFEIVCLGEDAHFQLVEDLLPGLSQAGTLAIEFDIELCVLAGEVVLPAEELLAHIDNAHHEILGVASRSAEELAGSTKRSVCLEQKLDALIDHHIAEQKNRDALNAQHIAHLNDQHIAQMSAQGDALRLQIGQMERESEMLRARAQALESSTSWRITAPLRMIKRLFLSRELPWLRRAIGAGADTVRLAYKRAPIDITTKLRIKGALFSALPGVFGNTRAYADWSRHTGGGAGTARTARIAAPCVMRESPAARIAVASATAIERDAAYVDEVRESIDIRPRVTAVAFYLPQFHPCPENDAWWGKGFTEWTNVSRALAQFEGHYQPHLPGELGFYDLRLVDVMRRQTELARNYGIGAFCFYYYWFGGRTLLELPVINYRENSDLDLPYCLCWANENWSRRWDGLEGEVLIAQQHSASDDLAFIKHIESYLHDPRYLCFDGRPVVLVYRPELLPDVAATARRWRDWAKSAGLPGLYLVYPQSFAVVDPAVYGFDAATEFPPNLSDVPTVTDTLHLRNPDFSGIVYDWNALVERSENYTRPDYTLFRAVCPSWDNEPRRAGRGVVFANSNPAGYQRWLQNAVDDTCARFTDPAQRLVFVNAWNEWAEGAHLEPDARYGYAWLEATRQAVSPRADTRRRIVLVTHDAHPHGAQFLALNMARELATSLGFEVAIVCLGDGNLKARFAEHGTLYDLSSIDPCGVQAVATAEKLRAEGFSAAIVNTTVSGLFLGTLNRAGMTCVSLVHELGGVLRQYQLQEHASCIERHARAVVFPAQRVRDEFAAFAGVALDSAVTRPQGLYRRNPLVFRDRATNRRQLRSELAIAEDAVIVLGVGYADRRKGIDLFVEAALQAAVTCQQLHFVWVGHWCADMQAQVRTLLDAAPALADRFHFVGLSEDTDLLFAGSDLYALSSREDPFPNVVLQAMEAGLPVVGFKGGGGYEQLLEDGAGVAVEMEDTAALAGEFKRTVDQPEAYEKVRVRGPQLLRERFSFHKYLFDLLDLAGCPLRRVSVVVPNYNYARYLAARLDTISAQIYPVYELLILDDGSIDDSVSVAREWLAGSRLEGVIDASPTNSGSVFAQWARGAELASGDYLWIAEADDLSDPEFLDDVLPAFVDTGVDLSYCGSRQIARDGTLLCSDYQDYLADISRQKWTQPYVSDGAAEIREALCIKNTIPNVSAVVFRRTALLAALSAEQGRLGQLKVAGDWLVYTRVLEHGKVAYSPRSRNSHRRHSEGVTISRFNMAQLSEIVMLQDLLAHRFELSPEAHDKAQRYAQKLYEDFGLREDSKPYYRDALSGFEPGVARILEQAEDIARDGMLDSVLEELRQLSLDDFGELLLGMPNETYPRLSALLPRMASAEVQQNWTGSSGYTLLRQSLAFVHIVARRYEQLSGKLLGTANVLDYGCGYGRLLRLMLYFCGAERLNGCDPWERSIDLCRESGIPGRLYVSDYLPERLLSEDDSVDLAYAFSVFTHTSLRATTAALSALHGAVRPGGLLVATIRPVEYWQIDPAIDRAERAALVAEHQRSGFAFRPHNREAVDGDVTYGDTSISQKRLEQLAPGWTIVATDRTEQDPYQVLVFLRCDAKPGEAPHQGGDGPQP